MTAIYVQIEMEMGVEIITESHVPGTWIVSGRDRKSLGVPVPYATSHNLRKIPCCPSCSVGGSGVQKTYI